MEHLTSSNIHTFSEPVNCKTVIISGGTTGIGRAAAVLLASYGAKLLIFGRHKKELNDAMKDISGVCKTYGGEVTGMIADQSKDSDVRKVFRKADSLWERIDIMINNAAISADGILEMKHKDWLYAMNTNLKGYMMCVQEAASRMKKKKSGHIINIGSLSAESKGAGSSVYVAAKSALQGFSESLSKEMSEHNVKVTLIEPGKVGTDMQEISPRQQRLNEKKLKMMKAQDIAVCIHYCLTQPLRVNITNIKLRQLKE